MIVTANTNSYEEVEGSPTESGDGSQIRATRVFRGPSADRFAFIRDLVGYHYFSGSNVIYSPPYSYPDNPSMIASSWSIKQDGVPVDLATGGPVSDLTRTTASSCSTGLECEITINYETPSLEGAGAGSNGGGGGGITVPDGTILQVEESFGVEEYQPERKKPDHDEQDNITEADPNKIPLIAWELTWNWQQVLDPNWDLIEQYTGKLNCKPFWGQPAFAVRFEGTRVSSTLNIAGYWVYNIQFTFRGRMVHANGYTGLNPAIFTLPSGTTQADTIYNGKVGIWNRRYADTAANKAIQMYWFMSREAPTIQTLQTPSLASGQTFYDMLSYAQ